ncbi:MAG: UDP-N-acetylglucosamine 2-epimerase [Pseudomonadota bacterium]
MVDKVCVVTGTRAEYGIIRNVLSGLRNREQLQLVVTAMHLVPHFGDTIAEIEADGFRIDARVPLLLANDDRCGVAKSVGLGVIGFADVFDSLAPDLLLIVGDRFEMLAAAQTALLMGIPIAHVHGGEVTEGAIYDQIRHAISKMANVHFVSNRVYGERLIQMGESPESVHVTGAPGLDNLKQAALMGRSELERSLNTEFKERLFLLTYHPVTRPSSDVDDDLSFLFSALDRFPNASLVWTYPNADMHYKGILEQLQSYHLKNSDRMILVESLGWHRYLSCLSQCDVTIGNSSSGIIEAPALRTPSVNIGDRQKGRVLASSVIQVEPEEDAVIDAIDLALTEDFKEVCMAEVSPFGDGYASAAILDVLEKLDVSALRRKAFHDLAVEGE